MYHSEYKYTTHNLCQTECFVILAKYMSLYKDATHEAKFVPDNLRRPMWRVETMVLPVHIGIHNHAVDETC